MTERSQAILAAAVGGALGAAAGYMFFTPRCRQLRQQLEPALDDLMRELNQFRGTVSRAAGVASEGWRLLNDAIADAGTQPHRYANPHQTTPF